MKYALQGPKGYVTTFKNAGRVGVEREDEPLDGATLFDTIPALLAFAAERGASIPLARNQEGWAYQIVEVETNTRKAGRVIA